MTTYQSDMDNFSVEMPSVIFGCIKLARETNKDNNICVVLGIKQRVSLILDKCSVNELYPQSLLHIILTFHKGEPSHQSENCGFYHLPI